MFPADHHAISKVFKEVREPHRNIVDVSKLDLAGIFPERRHDLSGDSSATLKHLWEYYLGIRGYFETDQLSLT